jgi:hypothetical protein
VDVSPIFANNQSAILNFVDAAKPNINRRESLALIKLLDAVRDPRSLKEFVPLG